MTHVAARPPPLRGARPGPPARGRAGPDAALDDALDADLTVEVHADPRAALPAWRELAAAAATPYQAPEWALPWLETVGEAQGVRPLIVVARGREGRAEALLPLALRRRGGAGIAGFIGGKDSNFNMGLFRAGRGWSAAEVRALLRRAASASPARVDLFALRSQPLGWGGQPNPLAALPRQPSPSFGYRARLDADPEAFLRARLSRDSRKKLRQKMNRLRALGPVSTVEATSPAAAAELIGAYVEQRRARDAAAGIGVEGLPVLRRFLDRTVGADGPVTLHGLRCGERIVATLAGLRHRGRFSGMITSFAPDPELARTSPGELLLAEVIRRHCLDGFSVFDLGVGEARYKETYCPEVEELFDSFVPVTALGHLAARAEASRSRLKRAVKQSRWAWPLAQRVRRLARRSPPPAAAEG